MTTPPPSGGFGSAPPPSGLPQQYGEYPPYGGYPDYSGYGYPQYGQARPTNSLAVVALVCGLILPPLGILFGHISLSQVKKSGEEGRGLALAGLILGYLLTVLGILVVVVSIVLVMMVARDLESLDGMVPGDSRTTATPTTQLNELPKFKPPATLGSNCQYPATAEPADRPVKPPRTGALPTDPDQIGASLTTNKGAIGVQLDNAKAPCTVNNFISLARQKFFDNTTCHRLTTAEELKVLQCGDPTGTGTGGPGYRFPNEYPTNQFRLSDPAMKIPLRYPRGTLAMANAGPGTNGSQFFLVYGDSALPPTYTVFGTIDAAGLKMLDSIAADGVADGGEDGKPATELRIESVRVG